MLEPSGLYYPNRIARLYILAMEDVMGVNGLNAILSLAGLDNFIHDPPPDNLARQFDFAHIAALNEALEEMYGSRGGRGIALRIGRATFARGMKSFGALSGMRDPAFRALPLGQRTRIGLEALAAVFSNFTDQQSTMAELNAYYEFTTEFSPFSWGRSADRPVCHALVGIIQESMRWASNGHEYHVQEVLCRAVEGEACVFRVNKNPIGQL
jgi:predicted hydrocarbon binding protein